MPRTDQNFSALTWQDADGTGGKALALARTNEAVALARRVLPRVFRAFKLDSEDLEDNNIFDGASSQYSDDDNSEEYSDAPDYFARCKEAVKEMHRQVGDLKTEKGIAKKGLLIRHLVLPEGLAGPDKIMNFIRKEISKDSYVNIMRQYHPEYDARQYDGLKRRPTLDEIDEVVRMARAVGLHRGF